MPNEISAAALLESDFDRIDEEVDRIAMAYCEARLVELAHIRDKDKRDKRERDKHYAEAWHKLREVFREEDGPLVHLLYWLDIRADYWATHPAPSKEAAHVASLLEHFASEAEQLQRLAHRARDHQAEGKSAEGIDGAGRYGSADALHALTKPHRNRPRSQP